MPRRGPGALPARTPGLGAVRAAELLLGNLACHKASERIIQTKKGDDPLTRAAVPVRIKPSKTRNRAEIGMPSTEKGYAPGGALRRALLLGGPQARSSRWPPSPRSIQRQRLSRGPENQ